jgi:UDP:flavonoid glycosyltransferase YjiC (YdhE family)
MQDYGHRVRLATHSNFKEFVLTAGLEFYPLGGDPKVLAGCMYLNALFKFWSYVDSMQSCQSIYISLMCD